MIIPVLSQNLELLILIDIQALESKSCFGGLIISKFCGKDKKSMVDVLGKQVCATEQIHNISNRLHYCIIHTVQERYRNGRVNSLSSVLSKRLLRYMMGYNAVILLLYLFRVII